MHELSVMTYLLMRVEEHADQIGAKKVLAINLVVGERSCIDDDSLRFYFDLLIPDTVLKGATLSIRRTAMRFHCPRCDHDYAPVGMDFRCPRCQTTGQVVDDGSDLQIESLEIEQ